MCFTKILIIVSCLSNGGGKIEEFAFGGGKVEEFALSGKLIKRAKRAIIICLMFFVLDRNFIESSNNIVKIKIINLKCGSINNQARRNL